MKSTYAASLALLLSSVTSAFPLFHKNEQRAVKWVTQVQDVYETVHVTTTVWVDYPGATPSAAAASVEAFSTPAAHPAAPSAKTFSIAVPAAVSKSSSIFKAQPSPTPAPAHAVSPAPPVAPKPAVHSPPAAAAPAPASTPASSSSSSGSADAKTGDITYYAPGMGSCGKVNTSTDYIVALSHDIMAPLNGANPNTNPMCGKTITISHGGKTMQATVADTCEGCDATSIDLTPILFQDFAPLAAGRVSGVKWWFN